MPELAALWPNVFFLRSESTANAERIEFCGCENAVQTEDLRLLDELLHCMYEYSRSLCPDIWPAEWSASHNPILSWLWEEFFQVLTSILDSNSARDISGISACMERGLDEPLQEAFDEMRRKLSRLGGNNSLATNQCIGRRATQILTAQTPI